MRTLLKPAIATMNAIRFRGKFLAITLMLALPVAVLLVLLFAELDSVVSFSEKERIGVAYDRIVLSLLKHTQEHRGMAGGLLNGDQSFAPRLTAKEAEIAQDVKDIEAFEHRHGAALETSGKWGDLKKQLNQLQQDYPRMTGAQSFAAHTALTRTILDFISLVGDKSNLTLDPDVDSYYLADSFVSKLPEAAEASGVVRGFGTGVVARKKVEPEEKVKLLVMSAVAENSYRAAVANLNKAMQENGDLKRVLGNAAGEIESTGKFMAVVRKEVVDAATIDISAADYFATATRAIEDNYKANASIVAALDELLVKRIAGKTLRKMQVLGGVSLMLALAGYLLAGFYLSVGAGMASALRVANAVATGDLTGEVTIEGKDETGQLLAALKKMQEQLTATVSGIQQSADMISSASGEIATGNADLSQRTEEQASSLEETASSMEELTSTVKQNAENAKQANQLAAGASTVAVKGGQVVSQVVDTMASINDSSKKIVDIIAVIDGIAFQTNILALNAAVEAARAGEQGRGFAVVATEVRNLAQRSAAAAKEIKGLISDSVEKVGNGTRLVDEAGKTMEEIVSSVKRVTDIMSEIAAASHEQSSGIEQVNQAITQMDQVTQQNAALVEEAAAAAESMQEQAQSLAQSVSVFRLAPGAAQSMPVPAQGASGRASIVKLLPVKPAKSTAAKPAGALPRARTGTDDEWSEF